MSVWLSRGMSVWLSLDPPNLVGLKEYNKTTSPLLFIFFPLEKFFSRFRKSRHACYQNFYSTVVISELSSILWTSQNFLVKILFHSFLTIVISQTVEIHSGMNLICLNTYFFNGYKWYILFWIIGKIQLNNKNITQLKFYHII